jgi:hypothetical protein
MLEREKGSLRRRSKHREAAKTIAMAKKIQVRKEVVLTTGRKAEAAERELVCITKDEDKDQYPVKKNISL